MENKKNEEKNESKGEINKNSEKENKEEENIEDNNNKDNNENNIDLEPINKNLTSNRRITNEEVKECSTLLLEEKDCDIFNKQIIKINASGMVGGREVGDGIAIFGSNPNNTGEDNNSLKTDFTLNLKEKYDYPYIFIIYFDKETKSYFIRPYSSKNNDNRILYVKLSNGYNLPLKQKEIISAGNIIFQVSPIENNNLEVVNLSKQNLSVSPKQTFDASSKKEVTIGRNKECDFAFPNNKSFSRIQTTFEFDE